MIPNNVGYDDMIDHIFYEIKMWYLARRVIRGEHQININEEDSEFIRNMTLETYLNHFRQLIAFLSGRDGNYSIKNLHLKACSSIHDDIYKIISVRIMHLTYQRNSVDNLKGWDLHDIEKQAGIWPALECFYSGLLKNGHKAADLVFLKDILEKNWPQSSDEDKLNSAVAYTTHVDIINTTAEEDKL